MHVMEAAGYGGPEVLRIASREQPVAGAGEVVVRMSATTVNPVDLWVRSGGAAEMLPGLPVPYILGFDITGTVQQDGDTFRRGDRVSGLYPWMDRHDGYGTYAETVLADPAWLTRIPYAVDDVTAATVPLNALAAAQGLQLLDLQPGSTLLVTGASGAVGGFATQLAARNGVVVTAVASSGDEAYVRELGANQVLSRDDPASLAAALRDAAPHGVDAAFDAASLGQPLLAAVRDGGRFLAVLGFLAPAPERGVTVEVVHAVPDANRLAELLGLVASAELRTRVAGILPLDQAAEAHRRVARGGVRGKVVLTT